MPRVRLFLDEPLAKGEAVPLTREQAHYLFNVMRMGAGDGLEVFDGRTGAYAARVAEAGKRGGVLAIDERTAPLRPAPDVELWMAPIKPARMGLAVEKATELGVRAIRPVRTRFANERWRTDKMRLHAVEAAEQCGGTAVPEVLDLVPLDRALEGLGERTLIFCDEGLSGRPPDGEAVTMAVGTAEAAAAERAAKKAPTAERAAESAAKAGTAAPQAAAPTGMPGEAARPLPLGWADLPEGPAAVLIGPEGGFSAEERARLARIAHPVALGPRVLRADTAAVAALTLWQALRGDW